MPRAVKDAPITTKAARERLAPRHNPYWRAIDAGAALGYRKGKTASTWLVRLVDPTAGGGYRSATFGRADDALLAACDDLAAAAGRSGGVLPVLDYRKADAKAREWIALQQRAAAGLDAAPAPPLKPYTVSEALDYYLADYGARGGKAMSTTKLAIEAHIRPALGAMSLAGLKRDALKAWHRGLAAAPARVRAKPGKPRHSAKSVADDPEAPRRRRSTANRILTILKAALNYAVAEGKANCSTDAWAGVKPFPETEQAKVRYLQDDEIIRLANACGPDFRLLVAGALLTGCRYSELASLRGSDFNPDAGTVTVRTSKAKKTRHVALTDEGITFFAQVAAGKSGASRLFERDVVKQQATRDRAAETRRLAWGKSDQFRSMRAACEAAKIEPPVSFHELRHTYGSRLAMRGVPMAVIAAQLGHSDSRMTEKHYAHLGPGYVADTVRKSFGNLGIVPESSVHALRIAAPDQGTVISRVAVAANSRSGSR
jgi:integrase